MLSFCGKESGRIYYMIYEMMWDKSIFLVKLKVSKYKVLCFILKKREASLNI